MNVLYTAIVAVFSAMFASGAAFCGALVLSLRVDQSDRDWSCTENSPGAVAISEGVYECTDTGTSLCASVCLSFLVAFPIRSATSSNYVHIPHDATSHHTI